jgi:ketosteroid isomerase-like protein
MTPLETAVHRHTRLFNAAVSSGDFSAFVTTFADDAVVRFDGVPAGPYLGRNTIAAACRDTPPEGTVSVLEVRELGPQTARVRCGWSRGGTATVTVTWRDDEVADLTVAFDEA